MYLNPFAELGLLELSVVPGAIDWGIVKSVDVHVRYVGMGHCVGEKSFTLRPGSGEERWMVNLNQASQRPLQREVSFYTVNHLKDGSTRASAFLTTRRSTLVIDDAFQSSLEIDFVPLYDPRRIRMVIADLHYEDVANGYVRDERLTFEGATPPRQQLRLALLDGTIKRYTLRYTIVGPDHSWRRLPVVVSDATLVFVGETFK